MENAIERIINDYIKEIMIGNILENLEGMFTEINQKVGSIATDVGQTPQSWNNDIYSMIQGLSETVIVPIAGMIITFVMCYELISMVIEKNNMNEFDTFMFFKYIFKMWVAIIIITHTFDITMAIFELGQHIVTSSVTVLGGDSSIDISAMLVNIEEQLQNNWIPTLIALWIEISIMKLLIKAMSIIVFVIVYGRMFEIYLYCSISPIPFATMSNKEWGNIGTSYIKGLLALAFQGFFIMICVGIYTVLVSQMDFSGGFGDIQGEIFKIVSFTVVLCFGLFRTGAISKMIFNAH